MVVVSFHPVVAGSFFPHQLSCSVVGCCWIVAVSFVKLRIWDPSDPNGPYVGHQLESEGSSLHWIGYIVKRRHCGAVSLPVGRLRVVYPGSGLSSCWKIESGVPQFHGGVPWFVGLIPLDRIIGGHSGTMSLFLLED